MTTPDPRTCTLAELLDGNCSPESLARVTDTLLYDPPVVCTALVAVMQALLPWPMTKIADWFWDTSAGQTVLRARWHIGKGEAITQAEAARLIFGTATSKNLTKLWRLTRVQGTIPVYRMPADEPYRWKWYMLLSDVEKYKERIGENEQRPSTT